MTATPQPPRPFRLGGVIVELSGDRVRLGRERPASLRPGILTVPGRMELPEVGRAIEATIHEGDGYHVPTAAAVVAFDADALPAALVVRPRRRGDRFTAFGHGERRLKTLLIAAKIPRWDRMRVPVVEAAGEIVWVAGVRRGAAARVTAQTRRILQLALIPLLPSR